jgi:hypothetical protein
MRTSIYWWEEFLGAAAAESSLLLASTSRILHIIDLSLAIHSCIVLIWMIIVKSMYTPTRRSEE